MLPRRGTPFRRTVREEVSDKVIFEWSLEGHEKTSPTDVTGKTITERNTPKNQKSIYTRPVGKKARYVKVIKEMAQNMRKCSPHSLEECKIKPQRDNKSQPSAWQNFKKLTVSPACEDRKWKVSYTRL